MEISAVPHVRFQAFLCLLSESLARPWLHGRPGMDVCRKLICLSWEERCSLHLQVCGGTVECEEPLAEGALRWPLSPWGPFVWRKDKNSPKIRQSCALRVLNGSGDVLYLRDCAGSSGRNHQNKENPDPLLGVWRRCGQRGSGPHVD